MYVVVLIDGNSEDDISEKEKIIKSMWEDKKNEVSTKRHCLCYYVLRKIV